jgi:hypothetical protein
MYEVSCAACSATFEYNVEDYIHMCPYCSSGFILDVEEGAKDLIGDHFIVPNKLDREKVEQLFYEWISSRYHRPEKLRKEFQILGAYGISLPYWVLSVEAHTFWSGHSVKANQYIGQPLEYGTRFVKEDGRYSRRYRWAILSRKSPKEHWGLERLHHPRDLVMVDWDGFPLDESMGVPGEDMPPIYEGKQSFKFEHANGLTVSGVQIKESAAISRAKDQITEYHRRICKTKVGTLYEHRTEIEVVGIHLVHVPFWVVRYAFIPKSVFKYFTAVRERRIVLSGYTGAVLEAELPLNASDKVMTNIIVCGSLSVISFVLAFIASPLFFILCLTFAAVCVLSAWKIFSQEKMDADVVPGSENQEPAH